MVIKTIEMHIVESFDSGRTTTPPTCIMRLIRLLITIGTMLPCSLARSAPKFNQYATKEDW